MFPSGFIQIEADHQKDVHLTKINSSPASSDTLINILAPKGLTLGYCSPPWCDIGNPFLKKYDPVKNSGNDQNHAQNVDLINIFPPKPNFGPKTHLDVWNIKWNF